MDSFCMKGLVCDKKRFPCVITSQKFVFLRGKGFHGDHKYLVDTVLPRLSNYQKCLHVANDLRLIASLRTISKSTTC